MNMRHNFPYAAPNQRIGLLGGSFDPPHAGHVAITKAALKRFGLDRVWWLVTPANPLKSWAPMPLLTRIKCCKDIMQHPKVDITGIEADIATRYTADTIRKLVDLYPRASFTWIMGADNLVGFHHWQDWQDIFANVRVGVLARPNDGLSARLSKAARIYRYAQVSSHVLAGAKTPAWSFENFPMRDESSTAIRAHNHVYRPPVVF